MRCKFCDFSPTAPSLSLCVPPRGVKLTWDDHEQGWTCGNQCGIMGFDQDNEEVDLDEDIEIETSLPQD